MKKKIEVDVITLAGIILVILGLVCGAIAYYNMQYDECVSNPVQYANDNNQNYWWDYVTPISYSMRG